METLVELLRGKEAWLMDRVLGYAREHGYTEYTSSLVEAWRMSISGLTAAVASAVAGTPPHEIELSVHTDWARDPVASFGLHEARLHRARGISLGMFLGLFAYYRQAYQDCVRQFLPPGQERDAQEYAVARLFDRMGIAFSVAWTGLEEDAAVSAMASTLREMAGEKNRYLKFFESLSQPVIFLSSDGSIENLNLAAARLVDEGASHGRDYYARRMDGGAGSLCGKNASEVFPWLADALVEWSDGSGEAREVTARFPGPGGERIFRVSVSRQADVTSETAGLSVFLQDETGPLKTRSQILRAKEELERTFDTISDMVFLVDDAGVIQRANAAVADKLGLSPKEVVGRTCREVLGCTECHLEGRELDSQDVSVTYPNLPGRFLVRSNELLDQEGRRVGKVVVSRDVTASDRIRDTLASIESKYKSIFDNAPVGMFQSTSEGVYMSVNVTMASIFGFSSTEEMMRNYTDIPTQMYVNPEDRRSIIAEGLEQGVIAARDVQLRRRDGSVFWGRLRGRVVRDGQGNVQYFEGFIEDVSGRRAARENLARSEQRFRSLAENMSQGLVQVDPEGVIGYCNDHFCRLAHRDRSGLIGTPICALVHEDDKASFRVIFDTGVCLLAGSRFDLRLNIGGDIRFALVTPVALQDADGQALGFWLLVLDITERRMLESQLLQTQKLEAIGQLAAGIAHEINTPTQYVMNNMWFIKEGIEQLGQAIEAYREFAGRPGAPGGEDMRAREEELQVGFYLEELPAAISETLQGLDRISAIVNSVKQFAHPGHDQHQAVDLNELVEKTVTLTRNEWKYVAEMSMDLDPSLPRVLCSSQGMSQVLLNLVVNAAHAVMDVPKEAGRAGHISIGTRNLGDRVEILVRDNGSGIPVHARDHLFEPFFTTKPVGQGTGQGLFIAHREVVKEHGGAIRFETELGQGTTFIITLPVAGKDQGRRQGGGA